MVENEQNPENEDLNPPANGVDPIPSSSIPPPPGVDPLSFLNVSSPPASPKVAPENAGQANLAPPGGKVQSDLLSAIRGGANLNKIDRSQQPREEKVDTSLAGTLAAALKRNESKLQSDNDETVLDDDEFGADIVRPVTQTNKIKIVIGGGDVLQKAVNLKTNIKSDYTILLINVQSILTNEQLNELSNKNQGNPIIAKVDNDYYFYGNKGDSSEKALVLLDRAKANDEFEFDNPFPNVATFEELLSTKKPNEYNSNRLLSFNEIKNHVHVEQAVAISDNESEPIPGATKPIPAATIGATNIKARAAQLQSQPGAWKKEELHGSAAAPRNGPVRQAGGNFAAMQQALEAARKADAEKQQQENEHPNNSELASRLEAEPSSQNLGSDGIPSPPPPLSLGAIPPAPSLGSVPPPPLSSASMSPPPLTPAQPSPSVQPSTVSTALANVENVANSLSPPSPPPGVLEGIQKQLKIAEEKAKADADAKAKQEADAKAKQEADAKAKQEADAKAKQEADAKAKQEADAKAKQEADAKAKQEADAKAKQEADAKAKQEADAKEKADADAKAKLEADKQKQEAEAKQPKAEASQVLETKATAAEKKFKVQLDQLSEFAKTNVKRVSKYSAIRFFQKAAIKIEHKLNDVIDHIKKPK